MEGKIAEVRFIRAALLGAAMTLAGCRALFPTEAGEELAHFESEAVDVGEGLPELTLTDLDGQPVRLSDLVGERPLVVQLGSHTCPVYRYRRFDMDALKREFADRVEFITVYTTEAHPTGSDSPYRDEEWVSPVNRITGVHWEQPGSITDRIAQANRSTAELGTAGTVLVDGMDNEAWRALGRAPSPAYVVGLDGTIVLRQVWVDPEGIKVVLEGLLEES